MADASLYGQLDPDLNAQMLQAQRKQALAQALMQQSQEPINTSGVRVSPLSVIAKALAGYAGVKGGKDADTVLGSAQAQMARAQMGGMMNFYGGGMPGGGGQPQASAPAPDPTQQDQTAAPSSNPPATPPAAQGNAQPSGPSPTVNGVHFPDLMRTDPTFQKYLFGEKMGFLPQGTAAEYAKARYADLARTPEQKNNEWQGYTPAMALNAHLASDIKNSEIERKAGNEFVNPLTGASGIVPKMPENANPVGPVAANGALPGGVAPMPGAQQITQANAGAAQAGKEANSIINVTSPTGATLPAWGGAAATAGTNQLGLTPGGNLQPGLGTIPPGWQQKADQGRLQILQQELQNPQNTAQDTAAIQREIARTQGGATPAQGQQQAAPQLGQSQTAKTLNDQGAGMYKQALNEVQPIAQHREILNQIYQLAQTGKFGPGTDTMARIKAMAANAHIDMTGAQTDQDVMKKLSSNMVISQLGTTGTGTDAQMETIINSVPNGKMTNGAIKQVVPLLISQLDAKEGRAKVANNYTAKNPNDLSGLPAAITQYNQIADPGTVSLGKQMAAASQNGTLQQFVANLKQQHPNDWQGWLQRVQQLDKLGAF
jgi:hypothetical protein